jgi:hypothetical protein
LWENHILDMAVLQLHWVSVKKKIVRKLLFFREMEVNLRYHLYQYQIQKVDIN